MDKQYSVQFFSEFVEAVQRLCRDYLDFDQAVEIGGYLSIEIDNFRKERYVLSEMLQKSGNVISESYCTKAFKTHSRCCADKNALRERHSNVSDFGSDTNSSRFTCASDSQMSGLETGNTQRSLLRSNQLRSAVRTDHERTSSGGDGVSSGPLTDRLVVVERSGDCCSIETYSDGYETQKKSVSLLSSVQRSPMSTAACNNLVSDKSGEEMRTTKRVSSLSSSSPRTCKRERLQQDQGKSSSLSMLDNSAASYSETSYQTIPSDSVSKVVPGGLFSEPCVASSTEEAVRLPLGALVKEEPDSEDCVMVGGSSEEDSNLLDPGDVSGDVSFLLDPLQSGQPTADVHSRSAAYTESLSSSPADRPKFTTEDRYGPSFPVYTMRGNYTQSSLDLAIKAVCDKTMSIKNASQMFSIPLTTLKRKVPMISRHRGTSFLSGQEEEDLVDYIRERVHNTGAAMKKSHLIEHVKEVLEARPNQGSSFRNVRPGYDWLVYFLKRHPELANDYIEITKSKFN